MRGRRSSRRQGCHLRANCQTNRARKNSRLVGLVLSRSQYYGDYPCHRIVNHCGRLVPGWDEQKNLLAREGIPLKDENHVDLKQYQWDY